MSVLPNSHVATVALGVALLGAVAMGSELFNGGDHMSPCVISTVNITPDDQYDGSTCIQRREAVHHARSLLFFK